MSAELCAECGSPLAANQRYCLICGARAGVRSPQLLALVARVQDPPAPPAPAPVAAERMVAQAPGARAPGLRVPSARISALLVLAFVGFGVLLGAAAGSDVPDTLAASVAPLRVVLPSTSAAAPPVTGGESSPTASVEGKSTETEPPAAAEQPTPSATASTPTPTTSTPSSAPETELKAPAPPATKLPAIKHVFVIMLSE
jgi:hypothetical protein